LSRSSHRAVLFDKLTVHAICLAAVAAAGTATEAVTEERGAEAGAEAGTGTGDADAAGAAAETGKDVNMTLMTEETAGTAAAGAEAES
jgi:hypothetical protein